MSTLREILTQIDRETPGALLDDGGTSDWDAYTYMSEQDGEGPDGGDWLDQEVTRDENGHICRVNSEGYIQWPPLLRVSCPEA